MFEAMFVMFVIIDLMVLGAGAAELIRNGSGKGSDDIGGC